MFDLATKNTKNTEIKNNYFLKNIILPVSFVFSVVKNNPSGAVPQV